MTAEPQRREFLLAKGWVQAAVLVVLFGFFVLGLLAYRAYTDSAPLPQRVVTPEGRLVFTEEDILAGQGIFLRNGLMQYGSVFGHGAYLGPDYTADYLRRSALFVRERLGGEQDASAAMRTVKDFQTNRYDPATGTLVFSAEQAAAFEQLAAHYHATFSVPTTEKGLRPSAIPDPADTRRLTAFFAWTAWAASARRPGLEYSYTNNWPPEPRVGNGPTGAMVVWSMLSLIALLGGIGLLMAAFGRWNFLGWHARDQQTVSFHPPGKVSLTPSQRACAGFFLVMAVLFLLQALLGGATQHYRAELTSFFGFNLATLLPFNLARTWHVQLSLLWVATSYLAAGIFLAPMVAGHEPRGQHWLAYALLGALVVVVFGSLAGEFAGIHGWTPSTWFGNQGFEYLDLGRFWQVLLSLGLLFWVGLLLRVLRRRLRTEHPGNMPWMFFYSALAIPAFYAVGLLARPTSHFTLTDFWRFWVVHLWVEDFLELFTTLMVAYIFVLLGVVSERVALRVIYLDIILYSAGGVIGTMHHLYFSGTPVEHMALGAFFSAAEVIPLTFLTVEAWSFLRLGHAQHAKSPTPFPHRWAILFLVSVGFWNFLGAGIFGFLINLPIVSYYEIGTALTANHGHAAMMGVYGMLAVGLAMFALRYLVPEDRWSERAAKLSFWSLNLGLAWMVFANLFPLGVLQLHESVTHGYYEARQLDFLTSERVELLEWLRLPGDAVFIVGGVLPLVLLCWRGVRHGLRRAAPTEPVLAPLFTHVEHAVEPEQSQP
ncbi:nitric-oxide reductase large subunit [Hyalangium minutum]|uniref:Nitric-oxide reductase n=1 Tax=Hyalangium minutum TaxID=394096 RepID=A0A085WWW9_9BACT|nr:cbb3-type cytochrome c oxidase subunit I [Hyalangium minutum]KFE72182.1 Nitric-oxide reductase [Hyalangium minutum]